MDNAGSVVVHVCQGRGIFTLLFRFIDFYFLPGLTYPRRSHRLSASVLPRGTVTSVRGTGIYADEGSIGAILGLFSSSAFDYLVKVMLGRFGYPQFDDGTLGKTPMPEIDSASNERLKSLALSCVDLKWDLDRSNEISHTFHLPALVANWTELDKAPEEDAVFALVSTWHQRVMSSRKSLESVQIRDRLHRLPTLWPSF